MEDSRGGNSYGKGPLKWCAHVCVARYRYYKVNEVQKFTYSRRKDTSTSDVTVIRFCCKNTSTSDVTVIRFSCKDITTSDVTVIRFYCKNTSTGDVTVIRFCCKDITTSDVMVIRFCCKDTTTSDVTVIRFCCENILILSHICQLLMTLQDASLWL